MSITTIQCEQCRIDAREGPYLGRTGLCPTHHESAYQEHLRDIERLQRAEAEIKRLAEPARLSHCRCGRPVFYAIDDQTPYCPACEYGPCATCDCVPKPATDKELV